MMLVVPAATRRVAPAMARFLFRPHLPAVAARVGGSPAWNLGGFTHSPTVPAVTHHNTCRAFSREAKSDLLEILAREEAEESEMGNVDMPSELEELKATIEQDWRIVEDGATTDMFLISDQNKVQLSFHCQDTVEDMMEEMEEFEEDEEQSSPVRFTVTVTKAGKTLTFACFTEYGEVKIEGVSTTQSSTKTVHENQGTLPKVEYQGPDYPELASDLQAAFATYLEVECGVTEDVAAFIAMFTDYREETQYVNFLKEAQSIIS